MGRKIGYARVSTEDQNLERQLDWMKEQGVDQIFQEKQSGKNMQRIQFSRLLDTLQPGDILYVESLSRLSRSMKDLLGIVEILQSKKIHLISLNDPINFSTPDGRLMMGVIAAMNQYHREVMLERQREGIEQAKKRGAYTGRKRYEDDEAVFEAMIEWADGASLRQAAKHAGISTGRLKNRIDTYKVKQGKNYTIEYFSSRKEK